MSFIAKEKAYNKLLMNMERLKIQIHNVHSVICTLTSISARRHAEF
jgi:hypothetical protein